MSKYYYVTAKRDREYAFLSGPYPTHARARAMVDTVRDWARTVDPWCAFDAFGVSATIGGGFRAGKLPYERGQAALRGGGSGGGWE